GGVGVTPTGTSGAGPEPLGVRLRGRTVGRMLAAPGASVPIPLPSVAPGWWVGDVALDPDELRSDDRRAFVWPVAPPAGVRAEPAAGPFIAAALAVLQHGKRVVEGADVAVGERLQSEAGRTGLLPRRDPGPVGHADPGARAPR